MIIKLCETDAVSLCEKWAELVGMIVISLLILNAVVILL